MQDAGVSISILHELGPDVYYEHTYSLRTHNVVDTKLRKVGWQDMRWTGHP